MATIPIYNPAVPFLGQIPGGFRPSLMIRVRGTIHDYDGRCVIDFINSPALNTNQDIIFHISIRPREGAIVRNSFENGDWKYEERYGHCRVNANETFEIIILAEHQHYKIAVNGHHLGVFNHRLPLSLVQFLHVSGQCTIDHILLEQDMQSSSQVIFMQGESIPLQPGVQIHSVPSFPPMQSHIRQGPFGGTVTTTIVSTPTAPNMHQFRHAPPMQYQPPPPYSMSASSSSSRTRIGGITIEQRPGRFIIKTGKNNIIRF